MDLKIEITDTPVGYKSLLNNRVMKLELDSFELYKEKRKYFIEMEKQKLIKDAVKSGLKEEDVILFL